MLNLVFNPAVVACIFALLVALGLVWTQCWHGHLSHDNHPGVQKVHQHPTPRIGGVSIFAGLLASCAFIDDEQQELLIPLILCGFPAFVFGLLEDLTKRVSVRTRLLATMACGVLGWAVTGQALTDINLPLINDLLQFTPVAVLFTAFAVGGVANAINIIDGFNGLAAGSVLIILAGMGTLAASTGDMELALTCLIVAGAVTGFSIVNWPLGRIFLGDGGAYFIGFALAWIAVLLKARNPEISAWAPVLVCGYPILEVLFSIWRRAKRQLNLGSPDRLHLHSLVKRRLVRRLMPNASQLSRNSFTGACMWLVAAVPVLLAIQWADNTPFLITSFGLCIFLYSAIYARLSQFRWCLSGATLKASKQPGARAIKPQP